MSGRTLFRWVGVAALLAALGVGAWIAWRTPRRRPPGKLRADLTLQVQSQRRVEVLPGTPITFDVYLTAGKGFPPAAVGRAGRPWHSTVRLIDDRSHKPLTWATVPLGPPQSTAFARAADGRPEVSQKAADVAVVDHDHVHHLVLATSPETMSAAAPGTYSVRAVLEGESSLESAPVTIIVQKTGETPDRGRLERDRVAWSAEFYLQAKRFEDARRLAEELATREPKNPGAWMLLGDALDGLGKPREALNVYRRALAASPRTYEEPMALYERMEATLRKLGR